MHDHRGAKALVLTVLLCLLGASQALGFGYVREFGSLGTNDGQFGFHDQHAGIAVVQAGVDEGNIWVPDCANKRAQLIRPDGSFVRKITTWTDLLGAHTFGCPVDVAVSADGTKVFVLDTAVNSDGANQVDEFNTADGSFVRSFGQNYTLTQSLGEPAAITTDATGNVFVLDRAAASIGVVEFNASGVYQKTFGTSTNLVDPLDVEMSPDNSTLYIADRGDCTIKKFSLAATQPTTFVTMHNPCDTSQNTPLLTGVTVDRDGNVYASETYLQFTVSKFTPAGVAAGTVNACCANPPAGTNFYPLGVAADRRTGKKDVYVPNQPTGQRTSIVALGNGTPVASFTVAPSPVVAGSTVQFSSTSTDDGTITSYAWDFGDGTTATGAKPTHVFAPGGPYQVKLTVTDDEGATGTTTVPVPVAIPPGISATPTASPTASATPTPGGGTGTPIKATVGTLPSSGSFSGSGTLTVPVTCQTACRIDAKLLIKKGVAKKAGITGPKVGKLFSIGSGKTKQTATGKIKVKVKISKAAKKKFGKAGIKKVKILLRLNIFDGAGKKLVVDRKITRYLTHHKK